MAENGVTGELTTRQRRAIAVLLQARSIGEAAKRANVGERTLTRWLQNTAFRQALTAAEGAAIDEATRRLLGLQDPAISVIAMTMADHENPPAVRLRAAQAVLDYLLKLRELRNVEERLAELEAAVYAHRS